jgi:hypothetical protein
MKSLPDYFAEVPLPLKVSRPQRATACLFAGGQYQGVPTRKSVQAVEINGRKTGNLRPLFA